MLLGGTVASQDAAGAGESRPNVLLIVVDDLGWTDLACYGSDLHETPRIDALAAEGVRFTRAYAAAPVCSPTRASYMTGKAPARLHMTIWYEASAAPPLDRALVPPVTRGNLPHDEVTLPEALGASDNGGFINVHRGQRVTDNTPLRSGKGSLYEGGIRVPLIVRWPGVTPAGGRCEVPVSSADLYPTILRIATADGNVAEAPDTDGVDITALLCAPDASLPARRLHWHYPHYYPTTTPVGAILDGRWKLLEYFEDGRSELLDLDADPGETRDLAASEPRTTERLRTALERWRRRVGAQMPVKNEKMEDAESSKESR